MKFGRSRFYMVTCVLLLFAAPSGAEPTETLDIYVLRGDASQLKLFQSEIGKGWQGGKFLERLSSRTEHRFWAYSTRTARQAREFMFGSMNFQLRLDIETYDQRTYYPKERALLDGIVPRCGLKSDQSFIQPDGTVLLNQGTAKNTKALDCVRAELNKAGQVMPVKFLDNKVPSERG